MDHTDLESERTHVASYEFEPLPGPRHMRLCEVLPDEDDRPLRVQISIYDLDSDVDFETLSYSWGGDPNGMWTVLSSGKKIEITKNLHDCLRLLRRTTHTPALWVDLICMNHTDFEDESSAIRLIPEIYRRSKSSLGYIESSLSLPALRLITDLERFHTHTISGSSLFTEPCIYHSRIKITTNLLKIFDSKNGFHVLDAWTSLNDFLNDVYWQRYVKFTPSVCVESSTALNECGIDIAGQSLVPTRYDPFEQYAVYRSLLYPPSPDG